MRLRVLITGSAGHIGREMVSQAAAAGHDLRTFDRVAGKKSSEWEHLPGDLRDLAAVRRAVQGVDAVAHLGALAHDGAGTPEDLLAVNVQGTLNVLLACVEAEVRRVVFFSSVNAIGAFGGRRPPEYMPHDDALPHHPLTPYQLSKHLGEEACRSFTERHGIVTVCLRPVYVVRPDQYERWRQGQAGWRSEGWKGDFWSYVDLRDVCDAALRGLAVENVTHDAFLLTADDTGVDRPTAELVEQYYPELPWPNVSKSDYLAERPYRSLVDCSHAKEVLGWQPKYSWREAS